MALNLAAAVKYLDQHKVAGATGHCARYVRLALDSGGLDTGGAPISAKDYGGFLRRKGFASVKLDGYDPIAGDVVVIQPYKGGSPHGHIAMYDGDDWISDFQQTDMWGGPGYRKAQPSYEILRFTKRP
jgi:hypothetical protein